MKTNYSNVNLSNGYCLTRRTADNQPKWETAFETLTSKIADVVSFIESEIGDSEDVDVWYVAGGNACIISSADSFIANNR